MKKKRFNVGDKLAVVKDGEALEGIIIDDCRYAGGRVLLIQFPNGEEEMLEEEVRRLTKKR